MTDMTKNNPTLKRSIAFIAIILLAGIACLATIQIAQGSSADTRIVQVLDGDGVQHTFPLSENGTHTIETGFGENTIEIADGTVAMLSADCPNHDCIDQATIDGPGEMILCLPHQLMVSVSSGEESDDESAIDTIAGR